MRQTRLIRVRQHEDGQWYPEVQEESGEWRKHYKGRYWRQQGYTTRAGAVNFFKPMDFEPMRWVVGDGTRYEEWPPRYQWAPGEEPKRKRKDPDVIEGWPEPCAKVRVRR